MAFSDEIKKLQRSLRCYLRYSVGPGSDNPGVSGVTFDRRYGKAADNTGDVPIKGTISKFGTFSRTLTNSDQGFEIPSITSEILDRDNEWRVLASRPWQLINRFVYYVLRVRDDAGNYIDSDIAWGQIYKPGFPPPGKARLNVQMLPGDYLGKTVPKRRVTVEDWPDADPSAVGRPVPIIYGKMDNKVGDITGLTATRIAPSGHIPPVLTGSVTTGGGGAFANRDLYYVVCAVDAGIVSSDISNVVHIHPDATNNAVQLNWTAGYTPGKWRVFVGNSPDFGQMGRYRLSGNPYSEVDLAGGTTSLLVTYPGVDTTEQLDPDPHFDLNYRQSVYYYLAAIIGGEEQPPAAPVALSLPPINKSGTAVQVSWDPVPNATSLILRRQSQSYHFDPGFDRQWTLSASAVGLLDFFSDVSAVTTPENFLRPRAGALELLYVDTNPAGQAGQYKYLVAGHGCKQVREVYVHKATLTQGGNPAGAIDRPRSLHVAVSGTPGTTPYRYVVSASNGVGETMPSTEVKAVNGNATLSVGNYNSLTWEIVTGAVTYTVYRAGEATDFARLASTTANNFVDDGSQSLDTATRPPETNTSGNNFKSGSETSAAQPILQTLGTDYFVETVTIDGEVFQIIRFNPAQDGNAVTANVWGIETVGDATGKNNGTGTLITNIVDQFKHFLLNWVFNSYQSGAWFTDTGYKAGLLDLDSFDTASTVAAARIVGGYIGAGAQTEEIDVRQAIQDWLASTDLDWYFWNGKFKVKMFDPSVTDRTTLSQYTPREAIFRDSFEPDMDVTRHWNKIPWQAGPQYDGYFLSGSLKDDDSIDKYERVIEAPIRTLPWTRHSGTATDVVTHVLRLSKNPPILATFAVPLKALNDEIATLIAVTHPDGIEAVSTGWIRRACKILRSDIDFDRCISILQVLDVDTLITVLGYVHYGSRLFSAENLVYITADMSHKSTYGYLADRTSGRYSNGDIAKKYGSRI